MTDAEKVKRLTEALRAHHRINQLRNDTDAYLWDITNWAFGEGDDKPNPEDFGINEEQK